MKKLFFLILILMIFMSCFPHYISNMKTNNSELQCEVCDSCSEDVCYDPDEYARYGDSDKDMMKFVNSLKFPVLDKTNVSFNLVICKHGFVVSVSPNKVNTKVDSVVLEGINSMHRWKPAVKNNEYVKSIYRLHFYVKPQ